MSNPQVGSLGPLYVRDLQGGVGQQPRGALVFAAEVNVADPVALGDTQAVLLSVNQNGFLRVVGPAAGLGVIPAVNGDDLAARATVAGPAAGGVLVSITPPVAGAWDIWATVYFTVVGIANNAEFREAATVVSGLQLPAVANQIPLVHRFRRVLTGAQTISINATAADAGGTYSAMLTARQIA